MYNYLFLDLGEKFYAQTSFTAGPRQSVSCLILIWHVLLRSCYCQPSSSSLSTYHSASVSSRQLGNLTTTFETIADLESIDGEATKREDIYQCCILVLESQNSWYWSLIQPPLGKLPFLKPLPTSYQSFLLADNERPRVFLARRLLVNWDGDGVLVAQGQVPIW